MSFLLSKRSLARLEGVHPSLVAVVRRAIEIATVDFMVVEGVRSREQCMVNYGKGRTAAQIAKWRIPASYAQPKLGKVTWLANPFNSKHCVQNDGYGHAVDLLPAPYDWKVPGHWSAMADAMKRAAAESGVGIAWGGDWTKSKDLPHFELAP